MSRDDVDKLLYSQGALGRALCLCFPLHVCPVKFRRWFIFGANGSRRSSVYCLLSDCWPFALSCCDKQLWTGILGWRRKSGVIVFCIFVDVMSASSFMQTWVNFCVPKHLFSLFRFVTSLNELSWMSQVFDFMKFLVSSLTGFSRHAFWNNCINISQSACQVHDDISVILCQWSCKLFTFCDICDAQSCL